MKTKSVRAVLFLLFIFLSTSALAQSHYSSRVYLGAHGGVDFSRVVFTPGVTQTFNIGGNAGVNFRYIEEKHFGFIVEAN